MKTFTELGGRFTFPGTNLTVNRMGYGAMQLAGPGVFGPPKDRDAAKAVLRELIELGVNHIDTSDFYGPYVTNEIICETLYPYPKELVIVTKFGARRGNDGSWILARKKEDLIAAAHDNLRRLKLEALDIVNLRLGDVMAPNDESIEEPLSVMIDLKKQGLINQIGLSTISQKQFEVASKMTDIVCVQNLYNLATRHDDSFIDALAKKGVAYVPYFPLGGFQPLQIEALNKIAAKLKATPMQVALAWLLKRSGNILLIPGTGSLGHLRENIQSTSLELSEDVMVALDRIGGK
ncbi:MAG TPA: oxidoreductase [Oculatellaceae cyanobacterium]